MSMKIEAGIALAPVEATLAALVARLEPVAPVAMAPWEAIGRIAAGMPPLSRPLPERAFATRDGFAVRALDLSGASSYVPVPLTAPPAWVEVGDVLPESCDCVVEPALIEIVGNRAHALAEAIPGENARRAGEDFPAGAAWIATGHPLNPRDALAATRTGRMEVMVRSPRLHILDIASRAGDTATTALIAAHARAAGAHVTHGATPARAADAVAKALMQTAADMLVTIGGTGGGRADTTVAALAGKGATLSHGLALRPGGTAAIGMWRDAPVLALPGAPDQALAAWWVLGQPVCDALSGRAARCLVTRPLAQKIASAVGMMEIALLKKTDEGWLPLAVGDAPLHALTAADAFVAMPSASEGFARGAMVAAQPLRGELSP